MYLRAQAEQQSTKFRIKALGIALEYKHLEVLCPALLTHTCLSPSAEHNFQLSTVASEPAANKL